MNTRLTNTKHASLNEAILQVQTESILKRVASGVRNTVQRVKNAASHKGFSTDAQVAARKAAQRDRWAREDAAKTAERKRDAEADRVAARRERERKTDDVRRRAAAATRSTKEYSSEPWAGRVED